MISFALPALLLLLGLLAAPAALAAPAGNKITSLPGVNFTVNFSQYAGYITVRRAQANNPNYKGAAGLPPAKLRHQAADLQRYNPSSLPNLVAFLEA